MHVTEQPFLSLLPCLIHDDMYPSLIYYVINASSFNTIRGEEGEGEEAETARRLIDNNNTHTSDTDERMMGVGLREMTREEEGQ